MEIRLQNGMNPEEGVWGSILLADKDCTERFDQVAAVMKPEDFAILPCRELFLTAQALRQENRPVDAIILANEAKGRVSQQEILSMAEMVSTPLNLMEYVRMAKENSLRRTLDAACMDIATSPGGGLQDHLSKLIGLTGELSQESPEKEVLTSEQVIGEAMMDLYSREESPQNVLSIGLKAIDEPLGGGFLPGSLYVLAGRPGIGKTTLGLFVAEKLCQYGPVLYISLEMTMKQLGTKRLARESGVPTQRILTATGNNDLAPEEYDKLCEATLKLCKSPMVFNCNVSLNTDDIGRIARQTEGLKAIVIDHLGLLQYKGRYNGRTELVTEISRFLKQLAIQMDLPVIALSQMNRASELSTDKQPKLYQLRDSGSIEQDADVVMLLSRSDYEDRKQKQPWEPSTMKIEFAKNRFGQTASTRVSAYLATDRVADWD